MRCAPVLTALISLSGCTPQQAEITGNWTAWFAASSSSIVWERTREQADLGWADRSLDLDDSVKETLFDCAASNPTGLAQAGCEDVADDWHTWLTDDAYFVLSSEIDAWRSEAILTAENDLQLTFHMDLGAVDFRVAWVVDPHFSPRECVQTEEGVAEEVPVDGADWVEEWSADEDGMYVFYLNAGAYQYNPYDSEEYWPLYNTWLSGYANAKFVGENDKSEAEEFNSHPSDFGSSAASTWYLSLDPADPDMAGYEAFADSVREAARGWALELTNEPAADFGYTFKGYDLKVEDNTWRPIDASSAGLDGWIELDASWVRLDRRGDDIEEGGEVSGDFQITFDAIDSGSRVAVRGTFEIPEIHGDPWGYEQLYDEKREENQTPTCE